MKAKSVIQSILTGATVVFFLDLSGVASVPGYKETQSNTASQRALLDQTSVIAQAPVEGVGNSNSSDSVESVVRLGIITVFGVTVIKALKS